MRRNIFKSLLDAVLYIGLYFVVPIAQFIAYNILDDSSVWFVSLLMTASLLYDSYTRYDVRRIDSFKRKVIINGGVALFLMLYSIALTVILATGVKIGGSARLPYIMLVVPFFISVMDLVDICKATF